MTDDLPFCFIAIVILILPFNKRSPSQRLLLESGVYHSEEASYENLKATLCFYACAISCSDSLSVEMLLNEAST